jgi:hypothetical protein
VATAFWWRSGSPKTCITPAACSPACRQNAPKRDPNSGGQLGTGSKPSTFLRIQGRAWRCILWRAAAPHSSSGASCDPDPFCGSPPPAAAVGLREPVEHFRDAELHLLLRPLFPRRARTFLLPPPRGDGRHASGRHRSSSPSRGSHTVP